MVQNNGGESIMKKRTVEEKRLIDANALMLEYDRVHVGEPGKARKLIEDAPTVEAVEIVRCRDCKHRYSDSWCEYVDDDDNFYCARGERNDGGEK